MTDVHSTGAAAMPPNAGASSLGRVTLLLSALGLLAALILQIAGPSDLFHQTQPRTIANTADILLHDRWILPREQGELPATKPPLYNWLAVPFVWAFGLDSELAHKIPSVLALIACWAMTLCIYRRLCSGIDHERAAVISALAALMFVATYTTCKLGYLARPDMLLTLWFLLAWWSSTELLLNQESARAAALRIVFWSAIALAWLTKGPVAILPLVYALLAARILTGSFRAAAALGWRWGPPLSVLPFIAWVVAAYDQDSHHVINTLWRDEFFGRIIGQGPETDRAGPIGLITGLYKMPYYFLVRGAPWSLLAVVGLILLWLHHRDSHHRELDRPLYAIALWMAVVLAFFSLSSGKRADYIASIYPAAAMLAAWALVHISRSLKTAAATGLLASALTLAGLAIADWLEWPSPMPRGHGRSVNTFIDRAQTIMAADPRPVVLWRVPDTHMATFLGINESHSTDRLLRALRRNARLWLIAGERIATDSADTIDLEQQSFVERFHLSLTPMLHSDQIRGGESWPRSVTLYRVEGRRQRRQAGD